MSRVRGGDDDRSLGWLDRMAMFREFCPRGPDSHIHLQPVAAAVASFSMAVVLGTSGWLVDVVPALLFVTVVALLMSMRHLDGSFGGGG